MQNWQIVAISVAVVVIIAAAAVLIYYKTRGRRLRAHLKPLSTSDRLRFSSEWMQCQAAFVEDPAGAVDTADRLVTDVLRARGRPVNSAYERAEDICTAHPKHADDFRTADEIVVR